jgi:hypothetical protein
MPSIHSRTLAWLVPAVLALVASVFLFVGDPYSFHQRSITELWNLGHVVYFGLLIYLAARWPRLSTFNWRQQLLLLLVATLVLGAFIEWLQYGGQRSTDWMDVSRDMLGSLLVLSFYRRLLVDMPCGWRSLLRLLAVLLLLVHLVPLTVALVDETIARNQFPLLSDFETPFELGRWEGDASMTISQLDSDTNDHQLQVGLTTAKYSGISMEYLPQDWRGYGYVSLKLFQPLEQSLGITVRIHDELHETGSRSYEFDDRFNRHFELKQGWNYLHIPLAEVEKAPTGRRMDMTHIRDISFFSIELPQPRTLFLDKIYLSN